VEVFAYTLSGVRVLASGKLVIRKVSFPFEFVAEIADLPETGDVVPGICSREALTFKQSKVSSPCQIAGRTTENR